MLKTTLSFLFLCALNFQPCFAEENPFSVNLKANYIFESDIQSQPGEVSEYGFFIRLGYHRAIADNIPLDIKIGGDHYFFDENTPIDFPGKAKYRGMWIKSELPVYGVNDDQYLIGLELNPAYSNAKGTAFDTDAFRFNFSPVLIFRRGEESRFEFVAGARVRPEYDKPVLPIIGFNYQATDKLFFNLVSDEPNVSYKLTDQTKVFWGVDYLLEEFEVTTGSLDGSIIEYQNFTTGVGLEHKFNEHFMVRGDVGGTFDRIIKFQDGSGKIVPEAGISFNLNLNARF